MSVPAELKTLVASKEYRAALALPDEVSEHYEPLAQGEYNKNYCFVHPLDGRKLVLRVNYGSQMHLEHQIDYEANALKLLEPSGRTPKVWYVDGSLRYIAHGILVMDCLSGGPLDYGREEDLETAARILADIHRVPVPEDHGLLAPENALRAILEECEEMAAVYFESPLPPKEKKEKLRELLDLAWNKVDDLEGLPVRRCIINTEVNNTNFLVGEGAGWLIDWEKPLYGDPAQDLGHFLAPTTTFWKTDVIFTEEQINRFLDIYCAVAEDPTDVRARTKAALPVICLRGLTWCAMAWVEYRRPERTLVNESTRRKLDQYLAEEFLQRIETIVK